MQRYYSRFQPWVMTLVVLTVLAASLFSLTLWVRDPLLKALYRPIVPQRPALEERELSRMAGQFRAAEVLLLEKWPAERSSMLPLSANEQEYLDQALALAHFVTATERMLPSGIGGSSSAKVRAMRLFTLAEARRAVSAAASQNSAIRTSLLPIDIRTQIEKEEKELRAAMPQPILPEGKFRLLHLCAVFGACGAGIQGLWSIAIYAGNRRYLGTWNLFYLARLLVGAGLAVSFCFLIEGGFVNLDAREPAQLSSYAFGAVSLVIGLFTGEAMEKLRSVAASLFAPNNQHRDGLDGTSALIDQIGIVAIPPAPNAPQGALLGRWQLTVAGRNLANMEFAYVAGQPVGLSPLAGGDLLVDVPESFAPPGTTQTLLLVRSQTSPAFVKRDVKFP